MLISLGKVCRDNHSYEVSKAAWSIFYRVVKYHSDAIGLIEATKTINPFIEAISPGSSLPVISAALWNFLKIIRLPETEEQCPLPGMQALSCRGEPDNKSIERDVKAFGNLLLKHIIKWHMIFRRLIDQKIEGKPFFVGFPRAFL